MQDEINSLCADVEAQRVCSPVIEELQRSADLLMARCWPNDEPCPCEADDGWTYARILHCFPPECAIFRPPHHDGWYVFNNTASLRRYMRFLLKHSWML